MVALRKQSQLRSLDLSHNTVCCFVRAVCGLEPCNSCVCVFCETLDELPKRERKMHNERFPLFEDDPDYIQIETSIPG